MRNLSLDETWDYTKRIWKWVAFQKEVLKDERDVEALKQIWLEENAPEFVGITVSCFFCESQIDSGSCSDNCPGKLVDTEFTCYNPAYNYRDHPGAFYREILRLDAIRTAVPVMVKPEWVHGDVFKNGSGHMMYLNPMNGRGSMEWLDTRMVASCSIEMYRKDCTFLFNINTVIKDKL